MQPHYQPPTAAEMTAQKLIGFRGRIDRKPYFSDLPNYSKIIFLNKDNLAELEGYKASVEVFGGLCGKQEIHIILTGFSWDAAKRLFANLKDLPKNEVYSDQTLANEKMKE